MKKYLIKLEVAWEGTIVLQAESKKQAREKAENILNNTDSPDWSEYGSQKIERVKEVKLKKDFNLIKDEGWEDYTNKK